MKILMATMSMGIGGAETHIIELCRALCCRGYDVCVASAGGALLPQLEKTGARHISVPLDKKDPVSIARARALLSREMKKRNFDIVHAHARIPAFICGGLQKKYGFRFVTTAHYDFRVNGALRRITNWGEHTFAVSDDLRRYLLREYGISSENVSVTVNGIDTERFSPAAADDIRTALGVERDEKMILHISRLESYSAAFAGALTDAMPDVCARHKAKAVIIGGGEELEALCRHADAVNGKLGRKAVTFLGAKEDVRDYIRACDIFAAPSRAALEAMSCAKPVIVGGSQGYTGIFSDSVRERAVSTNFCCRGEAPAESKTIAADIDRLLSCDADELSRIGEYNRNFISENYSVCKMADDHTALYEKIAPYKTACAQYDALICGYFGYGNMGDEAVLCGLTEGLRRIKPDIRLCIMTASPRKTSLSYIADSICRFDMAAVLGAMKKSRLLIFGGGNLLQDSTSNASLRYYLYILKSAKKHGMKIAVYSNGIGPVLEAENLDRIADALSVADSISMRERRSFELAKSVCRSDKNIRLTFDPVLLRSAPEKNDIAVSCGLEKEKYFVISPRETDRFSMKKLSALARFVAEKYSLVPVLIAMQKNEDLPVCRAVSRDICGSIVVGENTDPESILGLLCGARFLISSRLHTLICATSAVCPMMAYSEDIKLSSYLEYIGIPDIAGILPSADIGTSQTELEKMAQTVLQKGDAIREHIRESLPVWRALASYEFSEIIRLISEP